MPRNFNLPSAQNLLGGRGMDSQFVARLVVGVLLLLNLVAAYFVYSPYSGSAAELDEQLSALRRQVTQKRAQLERTKLMGSKIDKGRAEGDAFLAQYFLSRPTTYSTVVSEISQMAKASGVRVREHAFNEEEVEGAGDMSMLSITGNYEGTYADLLHFMRALDQANRLVIIESLAAAPQQSTGILSIALKFNTFVRETSDGVPIVANQASVASSSEASASPEDWPQCRSP